MKKYFNLIIFICLVNVSVSQNKSVSSRTLSEQESKEIFNETVKAKFAIKFKVFRIYEYIDNTGSNYLVLTERDYLKDSLKIKNDTIKAFLFNLKNNQLFLLNTIKDFILPKKEESNIWFFTKYVQLNDVDNDGQIDPIVVYGTLASNGLEDGRVKLITVYKDKKYAIRHQSGSLDFERGIQLDKAFYELPNSLQTEVISIMEKMSEQNSIIFPAGWQKAFTEKKTIIRE